MRIMLSHGSMLLLLLFVADFDGEMTLCSRILLQLDTTVTIKDENSATESRVSVMGAVVKLRFFIISGALLNTHLHFLSLL